MKGVEAEGHGAGENRRDEPGRDDGEEHVAVHALHAAGDQTHADERATMEWLELTGSDAKVLSSTKVPAARSTENMAST